MSKMIEKTGIQIGVTLNPGDIKAVNYLLKTHYGGASDAPTFMGCVGMVLKLALAHPAELKQWINRFVEYRDAEGMADMAHELLCARVNERREYRRMKPMLPVGLTVYA